MGTQFSLLLNWNCPFKNERTSERTPPPPSSTHTKGNLPFYRPQSCESVHLCTAPILQMAPVRIRDDTKPGCKDEDLALGPPPTPIPPFLPRIHAGATVNLGHNLAATRCELAAPELTRPPPGRASLTKEPFQ